MTSKNGKKRQSSKGLRNNKIRQLSATGMTNNEIAKEMGMGRHQISKILNSDEHKELVAAGNLQLHLMISDAVETFRWAMENKEEFGVTGAAVQTAKTILKSVGVVKESVDLNHSFPKPLVIDYGDGTKTVIGSEQDLKEEEE